MKVGFSLGRCIRDIVKGHVDIEDVVVIIAGTLVKSPEELANVISLYMHRRDYLNGLDENECQGVASVLWSEGKIHQSRQYGHMARRISEESVWADLFPAGGFGNPMVQNAWDEYRSTLNLLNETPKKEIVDNNWRI